MKIFNEIIRIIPICYLFMLYIAYSNLKNSKHKQININENVNSVEEKSIVDELIIQNKLNDNNIKRNLQIFSTSNFSKETSEKLSAFEKLGLFNVMRNYSYFGNVILDDENDKSTKNTNNLYNVNNDQKVFLILYSKPNLSLINNFKLEFLLLIQDYNKWLYCSFNEEYSRGYNLEVSEEKSFDENKSNLEGIIKFKNKNQRVMMSVFSDKAVVSGYMPEVDLSLEINYVLDEKKSMIVEINSITGKLRKSNKQSIYTYPSANFNVTTYDISYSFLLGKEVDLNNKNIHIANKINFFCSMYTIYGFIMFVVYRRLIQTLLYNPALMQKVS